MYMAIQVTAQLVRQFREHAGVTQTELARCSGMAQSAISDYERGRKEPSLSTLQRLAAAVELDTELSYSAAPPATSLRALRRQRKGILKVCERYGASNPRIFGSIARGDSRPDSDVDLLVDLEAGRTLFDLAGLHDDLVDLLGREVDILTPGALRGRLAHIAAEARPL